LSPAAIFNAVDEAFEKSLQELGWVKGRNIDIDYSYTSSRQDMIGRLVQEAVHRDPELFVAWSPALAHEVKQAAPRRPLVFLASNDGIAAWGLVSICDAANANGLPSIHVFREGALAGGLLAYGYDLREQARRAAAYVDKILRGTEPGSIPIEYMSKYELLINLKTAKTLGLTLPPSLLARADELIE